MAKRLTGKKTGSPAAKVSIDAGSPGGPIALERYALGQGGLSDDDMLAPHVDQLRWLSPKVIRLFLQEYYDVYPQRGKYRWDTLDRAVASIIATGAKPLMSICLKPPVLYPEIDQDKVHPTSYDEWDELIYRMVRRYNVELGCGIEYWEVFNEPDIGESGGCPGRFTPADYCTYYERTVRAIRRADASAKVGGPALAYYQSPLLPALLEHCDKEDVPIDFVSWHYYTDDPQVIVKSIRYVKSLLALHPKLSCETVIDEWNISLGWESTSHEFQPCFILEATREMLEEGLGLSCYYHIRDYHVSRENFARFMSPAGNRFMSYWWNVMPQFHGLFDYQGRMRPSFFIFKTLSRVRGARLAVVSDRPGIKGLAAHDGDWEVIHVLLWNWGLERPTKTKVDLKVTDLDGKKWRFYRRTFDAAGASNDENDRLHLAAHGDITDTRAWKDSFDLEPYGITFIALKKFE